MVSLPVLLDRAKRAPRYYLRGVVAHLQTKDIFLWAQAVAFKVLVTIVPVLILATGVVGQFLQREGPESGKRPFDTVAEYVHSFLPAYQSERLIGALQQLADAGSTFTVIGLIGLLFAAVTLFTTLRVAVGNVFQEKWHVQRSILGGYAFDLRMVFQVGLFFVLTFGLTFTIGVISDEGARVFDWLGLDAMWLRQGWRSVWRALTLVVPFLLTTAMFWQLFYFIPKPHPPKRSAVAGAIVTSLLWELAKSGFAIYATNVGRFDRYRGSGDVTAALGDTFGLILVFVFWVYFSGIVLCIGALIVVLHEAKFRERHPERFEERQAEAEREARKEGKKAIKRSAPTSSEASPGEASPGEASPGEEEFSGEEPGMPRPSADQEATAAVLENQTPEVLHAEEIAPQEDVPSEAPRS